MRRRGEHGADAGDPRAEASGWSALRVEATADACGIGRSLLVLLLGLGACSEDAPAPAAPAAKGPTGPSVPDLPLLNLAERAAVNSPLPAALAGAEGAFSIALRDLPADPGAEGVRSYSLLWPLDARPEAPAPSLHSDAGTNFLRSKVNSAIEVIDPRPSAAGGNEDASAPTEEPADAERRFSLIRSESTFSIPDHPLARGGRPRRADGTVGVKVVRDFRIGFRIRRFGGPVRVNLNARFLSNWSPDTMPVIHFFLDGEQIHELSFQRRSDEPALELAAASGQQTFEISVEGVPADESAHKLVLETLTLTELDGHDHLVVEGGEELPPDSVLTYALAPPDMVTTLRRASDRSGPSVTRFGRLMRGPAAVRSSAAQAIDVFVDGQRVGRSMDASKGEATFEVEHGRLGTLEVRTPDGSPLTGDVWWIQPSAALAEELPICRGEELAAGSFPDQAVFRHVTFGEDSRRSMLLLPGSQISFPLPDRVSAAVEFDVGGTSLASVPFVRRPLELELCWLPPSAGEAVVLEKLTVPASATWKTQRVVLPSTVVGGRLEFRCAAEGEHPRSSETQLVVVGRPMLRSANPPPRHDVLVYLVDTMRADHLHCYGYERETSPNFDALAADGILFEHCNSQAPWTRPSVACLFTGLLYSFHGAGKTTGLVPELETLAEHFVRDGRSTAAFLSNAQVHARGLNFEQGFEQFVSIEDLVGGSRAEQVHARVYPWLDQNSDRPFFLYVHTLDPHAKYDPPDETRGAFGSDVYARRKGEKRMEPKYTGSNNLDERSPLTDEEFRYVQALYDEEILYADREFGRLIDVLKKKGLYETTTIVLLSDHGEEFYEHGGWGHGGRLWETLLHVPLIVKLGREDRPKGLRVSDPVRTIDLYPTLAELFDLGEPAQPLHGRDLGPTFEGVTLDPVDRIAEEQPGMRSFERDGRKLIEEDYHVEARHKLHLYDLEADPTEQEDLAASRAPQTEELSLHLLGTLRELASVMPPIASMEVKLSEADQKRLEAIGYKDQGPAGGDGAGGGQRP